MILLVVFAILGATFGAYMRPRPVAVALALLAAGGIRGGLDFIARLAHRDINDPPGWIDALKEMLEPSLAGYLPLIATAGGGALLAAVMCALFDDTPGRPFWMPSEGDVRIRDRTGKYKRVADMIETRSIHASAEARLHAAHDGSTKVR